MAEPDRVCSRCGGSYSADVIFCPKDGTPLGARKTEVSDDPYLDLRLAGQFQIRQLIGIGAMGRVYRAHQAGIERDVAIKILHRDLLRNPTVIARFHREAKVASRLVHPNVVQVLMTGELEASAPDVGGEAYLVMEFLDGISLRSALAATGGAMPLPRALHVILQAADAVGEAHAQGIVHRDLKPENVMLVKRGDDPDFVKVLDFGVARIDWKDNSVATQAGVIFGTARYISPEGARGAQVGAGGDVYSLATMLFQCLSGETPFDGDNPVAILLKHTTEPAPDVRSRTRSSYVPEAIARVITANLAKEPAERCRDGREFGRALIEAARASGLHPDDLVYRSTLLGSGGALQLASMERTKALNLSAEAAARLASAPVSGRGGKTEIVEERTSAPVTAVSGAPATTHVLEPRPSQPGAPRVIENTLTDEPVQSFYPAEGAHSASRPSAPSVAGSAPGAISRTSASDEWMPPNDEPSPWRRLLVIAACFVVGAGLTLLVAARLGVFATPSSESSEYVERARAALAARAYAAPPGENVKDITDAALRRWPGNTTLLAVRADAARDVLSEARRATSGDRALAQRLTELALELDPSSTDARALKSSLSEPAASALAESAPAPKTTNAGELRSAPPMPKAWRAKKPAPEPPRKPAPAEKPAATPAPAPAEQPTSTPPAGGRWL